MLPSRCSKIYLKYFFVGGGEVGGGGSQSFQNIAPNMTGFSLKDGTGLNQGFHNFRMLLRRNQDWIQDL